MEPKKKIGPKKTPKSKKKWTLEKNPEKKHQKKYITFLGYPIRVILLVIFFGGKKVGKKLGYY